MNDTGGVFSSAYTNLGSLTPILIVLIVGTAILVGDSCLAWWRNHKWMNWGLSLVGLLGAAFAVIAQDSESNMGLFFGNSIAVDSFSIVTHLILLITAVFAVLLAMTYLENKRLNLGEYYVLVLFSTAGAMLMASANELILLFVGIEILSVALYVLSGFARTDQRSEESALKYFLLGAFAAGFLLFGIALIYGGSAGATSAMVDRTTSIPGGTTILTQLTGYLLKNPPSAMLMSGVALLLVGLGFKAALVPFHMWTPDVYEGAPTSVTAYMAAAAKIGAFAAILRVLNALIPIAPYWLIAVQVLAVLTMFGGNILAVVQDNVKRMLAYSSIAHAGYLLVAVAAATGGKPEAYAPAFGAMGFYLFSYMLMTMGSFGVLILLSKRGRDVQTMNDLKGLARTDPFAAYAMLIFMLSLGGIPPTMGFIGKWFIFNAVLTSGQIWLAIALALASVISIYYYLRVVWMMCFQEPDNRQRPEYAVSSGGVWTTVVLTGAATLILGIMPRLVEYFMTGANAITRIR